MAHLREDAVYRRSLVVYHRRQGTVIGLLVLPSTADVWNRGIRGHVCNEETRRRLGCKVRSTASTIRGRTHLDKARVRIMSRFLAPWQEEGDGPASTKLTSHMITAAVLVDFLVTRRAGLRDFLNVLLGKLIIFSLFTNAFIVFSALQSAEIS